MKTNNGWGLNLRIFFLWFFLKNWGLINIYWKGPDLLGCYKWAIHFGILDRDNWYWGRFDDENCDVVTFWGLGPLGCIARVNYQPV